MDSQFKVFVMFGKDIPYENIIFDKAGVVPVITNYGFFVGLSESSNKYAFFAGHREDDELGYETALREYNEESGSVIIEIDKEILMKSKAVLYLPEEYFLTLPKKIMSFLLQYLVYDGEMTYAKKFNTNTRLYYFVKVEFDGNISDYINDINTVFDEYKNEYKNEKHRNEMLHIYFLKFKDYIKKYKKLTFILSYIYEILASENAFPYCDFCYKTI